MRQHRPITPEDERGLQELRRRLEGRGLALSTRCYFGVPGIVAYEPLPPTPPGEIRVAGPMVFLYASEEGWAARVTPHGGPHWIRTATSAAALEDFVFEALGTTARPPTAAWRLAD